MKQKHLKQDNKQLDLVDAMSYSSDTENTTETESINKYSHRRKSSTTINHAHISIKHLDSTDSGGISNNSSISGDDDDDDDDNGSSGKTGRVRFAMNAIQRHEVESHFDYSDKERSKYWWSDREKDRMMAKHERLVAKYEQQKQRKKPGSTKKTKKIQSYRGLESWTSAGSLKLDYTIEQCISAVMDEQDRQWNENDDDSSNISKCSIKVTEDSARRARLNGLQDAQEALRVRGESWALNASDEMSVGSVASYGTAAFAKKKKRSKLLAKLDDSYKGKNTKKEDVLSSLNSSSTSFKKIKKKKKKVNSSKKKTSSNNDDEESSTISKTKKKSGDDYSTTSKTKRKNSKSKKSSKGSKNMKYFSLKNSIDDDDDDNIEAAKTKDDNEVKGKKKQAKGEETFEKDHVNIFEIDINNITANTTSPQEEEEQEELKSIRDMVVNAPNDTDLVSPLSTYNNKGGKHDADESPLLTTLRRQQQKLKKQTFLTQTTVDKQSSRDYEEEEDDDNVSPLLLTLRRQQREQANDSHTSLTSETSDPPGRRPRRLTSRHVEGNDTIPEQHATTIPSTTTTTTTDKISRPSTISGKNRTKSLSSSASADTRSVNSHKSFRGLRNGATNFFKTGGKGTTITANKKSNKSTSSTTKSSTK
jgi:hypothetical protein